MRDCPSLAAYIVDWHREQGYRGIQLNAVVETNAAAAALWRSLGSTIAGTPCRARSGRLSRATSGCT